MSLASSPDGRWLVLSESSSTRLSLLDWQTGEMLSHHAIGGNEATGLTFDPTSTLVAAFASDDNWGHCLLFRLDPATRALLRPPERQWWSQGPPDVISGSMALSLLHWELDRTGIAWPYRDLASTTCQAAFSPDSRIVLFQLMNTCYSGFSLELVAYDARSGRRLWCAHQEQEAGDSFREEMGGSFLVAPDGATLLVPMRGDTLLRYRLEDGALLERLPSGLSESVQALAFDHDGTLWLATEEQLVQYQPSS